MKIISLILVLVFGIISFSKGQYKQIDGLHYSQPLQVDSSDYYITGTYIDKMNKKKFAVSQQYENSFVNAWTRMLIYNSQTKTSKKVFFDDLVLIYPVAGNYVPSGFNYGGQKGFLNSVLLQNTIIIVATTDEYNKDGIIDEDDPTYLFIATKTGDSLTQISPRGMTVTSWTMSKDYKTILLTLQKDINDNKKFSDEDEIFYQINLDRDFTKIKTYPIALQ